MVKMLLIQQGLYATLKNEKHVDVEGSKWVDMKLRVSSTIRLTLVTVIKYDALEVDNL